jgi:hypothetical protein
MFCRRKVKHFSPADYLTSIGRIISATDWGYRKEINVVLTKKALALNIKNINLVSSIM